MKKIRNGGTDVRVRVRRRIVQIHVESTTKQTVVPIAPEDRVPAV